MYLDCGIRYQGIPFSIFLLLLVGAHATPGYAQMHSQPSHDSAEQLNKALIADSENVNLQTTNWKYHRKLQRRSRRFFIWGSVLTAIGGPLTIWGYRYMVDRAEEDANTLKDDDDGENWGGIFSAFPLCNGIVALGGGITLLVFAIVNRHRYNRLTRSRFSWQLHVSPLRRNTSVRGHHMGMHLKWVF